jgi:transcriptional regulator with XRE-family HTH domain
VTGEIVRSIRVSKNLTQVEFASKLHVSRSCIAAVESGHRKVSDRLRTIVAQTYGGDEAVHEAFRRAKEFSRLSL